MWKTKQLRGHWTLIQELGALLGHEAHPLFRVALGFVHLFGSRIDTQKSWGRSGALGKRNLLGFVPQVLQWALDPIVGHPGDAEQGDLSSDLTGAAKREPRTGLGAGGVQGGSRRDPGMEQEGCRHGAGGMQAWKEESREQQGGWGEQTLLPLLWQKSKLLSAWAVPKPLQLPHLLLWAFCIKRMNYPVWYQWNSCLPWGISVPELPQSPAKGPLESLGGRNQKPGHPWAAERLQGFGVTSVDIWVFVTKHRSVSWGRKRRFLCPGANKSCLVFLGAGPGCVSVSHLYRIEINNPVYAIIMNRKHKSVNLSGNINISD